jgi:hypothetical protein
MIALAIINYDYLYSRKHGRGSGSTVRHHVVNAVGLRHQRKKSDNHTYSFFANTGLWGFGKILRLLDLNKTEGACLDSWQDIYIAT